MKRRILPIGIVSIVIILVGGCVSVQTRQTIEYSNTIAKAREVGHQLVSQEGDVTGVSIAIMHDGQIIFSEGFGLRDREDSLPVNTLTQFNIGSVSKIFTAGAILILQQEGKLDLDDKVADIMPSFSMADPAYRDITVRMLVNHSSGMPGTNFRNGFTSERSDTYVDETLALLRESYVKHAPGDFSPYCNDGFTVAQALIEHITGTSFEQFLHEKIFSPLNMKRTSIGFIDTHNAAYVYADRTTRLPLEQVNIVASGGLTSTTENLMSYAKELFSPTIFTQESISQFLSQERASYVEELEFNKHYSFGLGWDLVSSATYEEHDIQVLGKAGGTIYYSTMLYVSPSTGSAVAISCAGHANVVEKALIILDELLHETGIIPPSEEIVYTQSTGIPLPSEYESYIGYYGSDVSLAYIDIHAPDATLHISMYNGETFELIVSAQHEGNGIFATQDGIRFALRSPLGVHSLLQLYYPHKIGEVMLTRLPEMELTFEHNFTDAIWVPLNIGLNDLFVLLFQTDVLEHLPSYLILNGANSMPFAITAPNQTSMVLPNARDQSPVRLRSDGFLQVGLFFCMNLEDVKLIEIEEPIVTGDECTTIWRRLDAQSTFSCVVPQRGRIIIYDENLLPIVDSLYSGDEVVEVASEGAYIAFISEGTLVFEPAIQ